MAIVPPLLRMFLAGVHGIRGSNKGHNKEVGVRPSVPSIRAPITDYNVMPGWLCTRVHD